MRFLIGVMVLGLTFLWAEILSVKEGEVVLRIDTKLYTYQSGEYPFPKDAVQVCYVSGEGKAILGNDIRYSLNKDSSIQCYQIPEKQKPLISRLVDKFKKAYTMEVIEIDPTIKSAAGTRDLKLMKQLTGDLEIDEGITTLVIEGDYFGEAPIYLKVIDSKGKIKQIYSNIDSTTSLFMLNIDRLAEGDTIEISDSTGKKRLKRKISFVR
jgi:hypothetical protein